MCFLESRVVAIDSNRMLQEECKSQMQQAEEIQSRIRQMEAEQHSSEAKLAELEKQKLAEKQAAELQPAKQRKPKRYVADCAAADTR